MPPQFRNQPNGVAVPINVIGPHLADSIPWQSWQPVDLSGVTLDIAKMALMPTSAQECGPFQMEDTEHGKQTTRYYEVAWSQADAFQRWCYGYSEAVTQNVLQAGGNQPSSQLRRVIPAQDPRYPYLYCDDVRLEECKGVILPDPGALMSTLPAFGPEQPVDPGGNPVGDNSDEQGIWPDIIYAEKTTVENVNFQDGNARFRVRYRSRPYPIRNDTDTDNHPLLERSRFVQVERRFAIQALALAKLTALQNNNLGLKPLVFDNGPFQGSQIPEAGVLLMPTQTYLVTCHEWPYDIGQQMEFIGAIGTINSAPFQPAPGWPPLFAKSALCQAPDIHGPVRNAAGALVWRCTLRFDVRMNPEGGNWNAFPAPNGQFYEASFGGGLNDPRVYQTSDFNSIFVPQAAPSW
jgi:hypothetical protein